MKGPVVLIHGAWSRGTTWAAVAARLSAAGLTVHAPDLPGHGADPTPPAEVGLAECAEAVAALLRRSGPALLVGHSMGGMVISAAAERVPDLVVRLVYVAAFLPQDGDSLLDLIRRQEMPGIRDLVRPAPLPGATVLCPEGLCERLCQDATQAQCAGVIAGLGQQPNRVQTEPAALTPERFGRVPRAYVLCRQDRTVSPDLQRRMAGRGACDPVADIDCGHLPQITRPQMLADILLQLRQEEPSSP